MSEQHGGHSEGRGHAGPAANDPPYDPIGEQGREGETRAQTAADAPPRPAGTAPNTAEGRSGESAHAVGDPWPALQMRFVDDPAGAVRDAVQVLQRAVPGSGGGESSPAETEHLRMVFTTLRDMHARLRS